MIIPEIDTNSVNDSDLEKLTQIGFCYVKISDEILNKIQTCMKIAMHFFQQTSEEKNRWQLKKILNRGDLYQGYALRSQSKNTNAIEQLFFEPHSPFGPYENKQNLIKDINHYFMNLIFTPIMRAIFKKLNLDTALANSVINEPNRSYVFQLCPTNGKEKNNIRLNEHLDFGFLTIVYFEKPGLEVMYQNAWHAIMPRKNCVVINLGNATELITQGQCRSALHRVTNATDNRLSSVYFINPNYQRELRNLMDHSLIASSGEEFFKQQFSEYTKLSIDFVIMPHNGGHAALCPPSYYILQ